ncbi:hypothetical protein [Aliikangiella sp. IMCC44359]|uniref:hypothetical protein n=1 Tax=Aliikangiella sp. IMCC44359 TaxID=3459125 RepID=UPI00403AFB00
MNKINNHSTIASKQLLISLKQRLNLPRLIQLLILIVLSGCTQKHLSTPITVLLKPIHSVSNVSEDLTLKFVELVDNDGNMYISQWELISLSDNDFSRGVEGCRNKLEKIKLFQTIITISNIDINQIKPSQYKKFTQCIADLKQPFISAQGYSPNKYLLSINRSHSMLGQYMPVGASYYLEQKGIEFKSLYQLTKQCHSQALTINKNGIDESYTGNYSQVSIKPYVEKLLKCLSKDSIHISKFVL